MARGDKTPKCSHEHNGNSWGQAWDPSRGFVYDEEGRDETRFATEIRCINCGETLSVIHKEKRMANLIEPPIPNTEPQADLTLTQDMTIDPNGFRLTVVGPVAVGGITVENTHEPKSRDDAVRLHERSQALDTAATLLDNYPFKGMTILEISNVRTCAKACRMESAALLRRARNATKR